VDVYQKNVDQLNHQKSALIVSKMNVAVGLQ
jgi:hypothetical protein